MVTTMFENFSAPAVFIASQATMSLYSTGRFNGLVCDSGFGATYAVPVSEGI